VVGYALGEDGGELAAPVLVEPSDLDRYRNGRKT
jgi:hypothetical protein